MLAGRTLGRRFPDRERGPRFYRRRGTARRLWADARARSPRLPPLRRAVAGRQGEYPPDGDERHGDHAGERAPGPAKLRPKGDRRADRSEEHTSELQSLMRISYAVFCLKKKKT